MTNGYTPLMIAIQNSNIDTVKLLIENGADVNEKDFDGNDTPLYLAIQRNNLDIVKLLIKKGAYFLETNDDGDYTALILAEKCEECGDVYYFLDDLYHNFLSFFEDY